MWKASLLLIAFALGCSPTDRSVGAACRDHFDCKDRCLSDWPGGMCTLDCRDDRDCPPDSACSDTKGGVCLLLCRSNSECRDMLGDSDYKCDDLRNRGGGRDDVCVPD